MSYKTFEYVWLDGYETQNLRSKIKIIHTPIDTSNCDPYKVAYKIVNTIRTKNVQMRLF